MLGAIIGDIVGSRFEFNPINDYNFELFTNACGFTDDTICTIAVADAILKGVDYGVSIHKWCRKYPHPMGGYGGRFRQWVLSDNPQPYGSFGNGSAMRVSPIGWWYEHPDDLHHEAVKSASCTHNHQAGIDGAVAVVAAVRDCRILRKDKKGQPITADNILWSGLSHSVTEYVEFPQQFHLDIEQYRNKFDETCQGTVPVALWIVMHSHSFEDAIRKAVSLGADADTLGAIVGSMAEALWGIPEWMKQKALTYLPQEMKEVANEFHHRLNRLRKLTQRCQFYLVGDFNSVDEKNQPAYQIEHEWANDLSKSYSHADAIKKQMALRAPLEQWQNIADDYDLPISLIGYIGKHLLTPKHKTFKVLIKFLDEHYSSRKPMAQKKKQEKEEEEQMVLMMKWKLGLGHMGKFFTGEPHIPSKDKIATSDLCNVKPMPNGENVSSCPVSIQVNVPNFDLLKRGHIPESQEDHWFMFVDDKYIHYYRSWTGQPAFQAHYVKTGNVYTIDNILINQNLAEFGVNGDEAGVMLFIYLVTAEVDGDAADAWKQYIKAWGKLNAKFADKKLK